MPVINHFGQPIGEPLTGWTARPRPARIMLPGDYCRLEPLEPARHRQALYDAYYSVPHTEEWTYLPVERPADQRGFQALLEGLAGSEDQHMAVIDKASGEAVGSAAFMRIQPVHGVAELGWINWSLRMQRQRTGTEAIYLMLRYLFDDLGYRRCEWKCDSLNAPSRAAALRYGFQYEGCFRQAIVTKGRNRDTAWFALLDSEWPAVRQALAQWLAPENFDEQGQQRHRLQALMP
ncbi:GNAT family N-acetyltransferase [Nissabacter sp. SGAir0207]|uniref:GNAT family N-acetyltransferase n=1 Tax=Nissabacter sp. SGAir0207 TaxID=2126321 RepID=UPI0010CCE8B0|nr:GNAT family protein [Nissabacter sp. SGAir0207]QCR35630.1 GNAT family N-acetyltransferase [Nissabacter sp. SGAir0207]